MNSNEDFIKKAEQTMGDPLETGPYFVLIADFIDFHPINFFYGEAAGDALLDAFLGALFQCGDRRGESTLQSLQVLAASQDDPDFRDTYLLALNEASPDIKYMYLSTDYIEQSMAQGMLRQADMDAVDRLRGGETAAQKAELLLKSLEAGVDTGTPTFTASIGSACYPQDGTDFAALFSSADRAMYLAKRRGKRQSCFADELDEEK